MSKRLFSVLVLAMVMALGTIANAEWVSLDGSFDTQPQISVRQEAANLTVLDIAMPGFDVETVDIEGNQYSRVRVPGNWFTLDRGEPELPFLTSSLIIPDSGTPVVRVVASQWREIAAAPVVPSKGNILRTQDPNEVSWTFGDAYSTGGLHPTKEARLADPYILRDYRGVSLRVYPVRWDADRGVLLALESMTLEVETSGSGGINEMPARVLADIDPQFDNLYRLGFDNYATADKYEMVGTDGPMLIVCYDAFMGAIQPFVEWKRERGLDVEVITTGSVGGTTSGIQGAISDRFNTPEGLTYVVFIGDIAQVPTYSGTYEGADDDTRYANLLGGDLYPELFVSRISAQTPEHVQTQINKFIRYERDPDAGGDWYHKGTGLASNEGSPADYTRAEWLRQDLLGYTFTEVDEIYQPSATSAHVAAAVNEGRSIVNYIGHGSGSSWSNPPFTTSDVLSLTNGWMHPWILDVSCSNGDFSQNQCFAEAWLRVGSPAQPYGAVAMYSASTSTPWVPPCVMQAEAVDLLVGDQANVIGSLYYHGIMAVMDEYPGNTQLVEQYNIFGDCSLVVRTDTPNETTVVHAGTIALGAPEFYIETGIARAQVALYSNGILHGAGQTDTSGNLNLILENPVYEPGEVTLTVTGYNVLTYRELVPAVVPVAVDIDPATIPVGVTTHVTVTLMDPPKTVDNVTVTIEGYGVSGLEVTTGPDGTAVFDVTPVFGEDLIVRGREVGTEYDMFTNLLPVAGAAALGNPALNAEVESIGMVGTLTPHIEGAVTATADNYGLELVVTGAGLDASAFDAGNSIVLPVTPTETGVATAAILKAGYDVFTTDFDVVPAYGTLAGTVVDGDNANAPVSGAYVAGYVAGEYPAGQPVFELYTNASGAWTVDGELPVGNYEVLVEKFGYLETVFPDFLLYGANDWELVLDQAPSGVLTGMIYALEGGAPLEAVVKIFRQDNGELLTQTTSDGATGIYTTDNLPYFSYSVVVTAYQFVPQTTTVTIATASTTLDFALEPTVGNILLIDDNSGRPGEIVYHPAKLDKLGDLVAPGYASYAARAADDIQTDLEALGYTVNQISISTYDPADWVLYDLILVSSGDNTGTLNTGNIKQDLEDFVAGGGHVMIEGGEVAYDHQSDTGFSQNVLHVSDWITDNSGAFEVFDPDHFVMSVPNTVNGPINVTYTGYGDQDAVAPTTDAAAPGGWASGSTRYSVVCYDENSAPQGGQIVFFAFNYSAFAVGERDLLLHNAVNWLVTPEIGDAALGGQVIVNGAADNSGVTLTLTPGNFTAVTDASGEYLFDGLFGGEFHITATKDGWSSGVADVTVPAGGSVMDVDFTLNAILTTTYCDAPDAVIPDNDPDGGVYCPLTLNNASTASKVEVFLDISHTFIGDLIVDLIAPSGNVVRLHKNTGGSTENIYTWYPEETTPYESLNGFIGEPLQGDWQLHVVDVGPQDTGVINEWCLRVTYEALTVGVDDGLPQVLSLEGNYPNPFNPVTSIKFAIPRSDQVELAVYNLRGQRVALLMDQVLEAGSHSVTWTGRDDSGRVVSSGTYFYRLVVDGEKLTGKMLLMK